MEGKSDDKKIASKNKRKIFNYREKNNLRRRYEGQELDNSLFLLKS